MTSNQKKILWTLGIVGGAAGLFGLCYFLYRRNKQLGSTLTKSLPEGIAPARIVNQVTTSDGKRATHWYASHLPIKKRVALVQDMVYKSVMDPDVRILAMRITRSCPARDKACEAKAIDDWISRNIRYAGDVAPIKMPNGRVDAIDYFSTAKRVLQQGAGDCDEHAVLAAALLSMNDIEARLRVTSPHKDKWSHIYVVANVNGAWTALDSTLPGEKSFGTEAGYANKLDFSPTRNDKEFPA